MLIQTVLGDITDQAVDAIVNAANPTLLGGGGVDGAVHRRGGPRVLAACQQLRDSTLPAGLPPGDAVATTAGDLPARWAIHAVGPVYDRFVDRSATLASAYRRSLQVADDIGAGVVAFPALSTGAYGWPMTDAAQIAVTAVKTADTHVELVRFVLITQKPLAIFTRALKIS